MASLRINIRRHTFNVACAKGGEAAMKEAARAVEEKIDHLRGKTGVADGERAALMAALQIAYEARQNPEAPAAARAPDVSAMVRRINDALARTDSSLQGHASDGVNQ